jgi:ketosteroid isomerase-like protein
LHGHQASGYAAGLCFLEDLIMRKGLTLAFLLTFSALLHAGPRDDVAAVIDRFHRAAASADFATYRSQMTADIVFLGTDATERWQGGDFFEFARRHFNSGKGWTYVPTQRNIDLDAAGEVAWFDELLHHDKLGICRGSGLLLLTTDGWKIAQYNLSMPVPNQMIERVADAIAGKPAKVVPPGVVGTAGQAAGSDAAVDASEAADR